MICSLGQSEAITRPGQLRRFLFGWIPIADWDSEERNRDTGTLPLPRLFRESVEIFREKGKSRPVGCRILSRSSQVDVLEWPMLKAMLNRLTVDQTDSTSGQRQTWPNHGQNRRQPPGTSRLPSPETGRERRCASDKIAPAHSAGCSERYRAEC